MSLNNFGSRIMIILIVWVVVKEILGIAFGFGAAYSVSSDPLGKYSSLIEAVNQAMPEDIGEKPLSEYDLPNISSNLVSSAHKQEYINVFKVFQGSSSFFGFVGASLLICLFFKKRITDFFKFNTSVNWSHLLAAPFVFIVAFPLISISGSLNEAIPFPEFMSGWELELKIKEFQLSVMSFFIGSGEGSYGLISSILVMAVIPAIGEELLFRGVVQRTLLDFKWNHHKVIWLTAFIFSAMHLQFYGFIPRLILGATLGYLYFWSNNIWIPILGHFVQNASSVIMLNMYVNGNQEDMILPDETSMPIMPVLISILAFTGLMYHIYKTRNIFVVESIKNSDISSKSI